MFEDSKLFYWKEAKNELLKLIDNATLAQIKTEPNLDGDKDCKLQWRLSGIFGLADMLKEMLSEGDGEKDAEEDV